MIVDLLSIYREPDIDIEKELIQLVYYGKLSYIDVNLMTYPIRQMWLTELKKMIEAEYNTNGLGI
jgi:hypothetical protein